jgi:hypothetical protein
MQVHSNVQRASRRVLPFVLAVAASGCGSDATAPDAKGPDDRVDVASLPAGITVRENDVIFKTEEFTLPAGQERFLCYAADAPVDFNVGSVSIQPRPVVHHLFFSKTTDVDALGFAECDTLIKTAWRPIVGSTTAGSSLELPSDSAHIIAKGQRLVAQLHLLNTAPVAVSEVLWFRMGRSKVSNPRPVGLFVTGALGVRLPPLQQSTLEGSCILREDVDLFAIMPHMHYLGRSLTFEIGPSEAELELVFKRDPYNFDDQYIEPFKRLIPKGYHVRTRCTFDNTRNEVVTFGESSLNEMCFTNGFASGIEGVSACLR